MGAEIAFASAGVFSPGRINPVGGRALLDKPAVAPSIRTNASPCSATLRLCTQAVYWPWSSIHFYLDPTASANPALPKLHSLPPEFFRQAASTRLEEGHCWTSQQWHPASGNSECLPQWFTNGRRWLVERRQNRWLPQIGYRTIGIVGLAVRVGWNLVVRRGQPN